MFSTILMGIFGGLAGAWFRYLSRNSRRPWLVTAALAAAGVCLLFLTPRGQELYSIWGFLFAVAAAGALLCGAGLRLRRPHK